jgi:hypothetical protein
MKRYPMRLQLAGGRATLGRQDLGHRTRRKALDARGAFNPPTVAQKNSAQ